MKHTKSGEINKLSCKPSAGVAFPLKRYACVAATLARTRATHEAVTINSIVSLLSVSEYLRVAFVV